MANYHAPSIAQVAAVLADLLPEETLAEVIDCLLCCNNLDDDITEKHAAIGGVLFDELCCIAPAAMLRAQGRPLTDVQKNIVAHFADDHHGRSHNVRCIAGMVETGECTLDDVDAANAALPFNLVKAVTGVLASCAGA